MNSILNIYSRFFNYAFATPEPKHSGNTTKRLSELCKVFLSTALSSRNPSRPTHFLFQLPEDLMSIIINDYLSPQDRLYILFTCKFFEQLLIKKHFLSAPKNFQTIAEFTQVIKLLKPMLKTDPIGFEVKLSAMLTEPTYKFTKETIGILKGETECHPQQLTNKIHIEKAYSHSYQSNLNEISSLRLPYSLFIGTMRTKRSSIDTSEFKFQNLDSLSSFNCHTMTYCDAVFSELPNLTSFKIKNIETEMLSIACCEFLIKLTLRNLPNLKTITFGNITRIAHIKLENLPQLETINFKGKIENPATEAYLKNFLLQNKNKIIIE